MKRIEDLKYPQDRVRLALLSIPAFQRWYAAQNVQHIIWMAQDEDFQNFLNVAYLWKVSALRTYFKIKHFFESALLTRTTLI